MPELSYGSHIFQDLVEAEILYTAIFEGSSTCLFQVDKLRDIPNALEKYVEGSVELRGVVHVCETSDKDFALYYDMVSEHLLITVNDEERE